MGLFGSMNPLQASTMPTARDGLFGTRPQGIEQAAAYTGPVKKGGLFGSGVRLADVAGLIGDTLLSASGQAPIYTPNVLQQRQQDTALKRQALQQQQELAQQMALYDYKRANPMPINNDTANDYAFRVSHLGQAAADEWLKSQGDPVVTVPLGPNRVYSGPRSGLGAALSGGGQASGVPKVMDQASYDAVPPGAQYMSPDGHIRTKGGSSGNAGGGFR